MMTSSIFGRISPSTKRLIFCQPKLLSSMGRKMFKEEPLLPSARVALMCTVQCCSCCFHTPVEKPHQNRINYEWLSFTGSQPITCIPDSSTRSFAEMVNERVM